MWQVGVFDPVSTVRYLSSMDAVRRIFAGEQQGFAGAMGDPSCIHVFEFKSDNAVTKMKAALAEVDMNELWAYRKNPPNPIPAVA